MLEAEIVDRDYSNSTSTPSMKKAIKFAIFYKLRCANGFCLMVMIVEILKKKCIKHIQNNHFFLKKIIIPNTYKTCEVRHIFEKVFS